MNRNCAWGCLDTELTTHDFLSAALNILTELKEIMGIELRSPGEWLPTKNEEQRNKEQMGPKKPRL